MSAAGRWVRVADGLADGVGETGAGSVAMGAGVLAALLTAGVAIPATGAGACDVAATTGAAALKAGIAVDLADAGDFVVRDTVGAAARVGAALGLLAVGWCGVAVTAAGDAWPSGGAADRPGGLALAVGVA
ncbi:MAG: hypothetical protein ACRDOI_28905 [Trebonia sp.]